MLRLTRNGSVAQVPSFRVRTVSARTVDQFFVEVAEGVPAGERATDLCGPDEAEVVDLARRFTERFDLDLHVTPVDWEVPPGALLPDEDSRIIGPTFDEWLASEDAASLGRAL
ncbi:MAG: hypothetical protein ACRDXC_03400 [Acidimicrobiales bacterium]